MGKREIDGLPVATLSSEALGGIEAAIATEADMVISSLRHRGEELLGLRGGLRRYIEDRSTMGIPLLYPWANRLAAARFEVAGRQVDVEAGSPRPRHDSAGLPIHGLLSAIGGWQLETRTATDDGGMIQASFEFGAQPGLLAAYPFPHRVAMTVRLRGATLTITTAVEATDGPVPVSFGFHPYLRLPGVPRAEWEAELPVIEQVCLDHRELPTGEREAARIPAGPLGSRTFDHAFVAPAAGAPFALSGAGRRIEVAFGDAYPYAQVYAPADDDVIAFEPMTAPTNALVEGGSELLILHPGERFEASFSIRVRDDPAGSAA